MKNHKVILGIDVSKLKLDILTIDGENNVIYPNQIIKNQPKEIKKILNKIRKEQGERIIVAFENTGVYSYPLTVTLGQLEIDFVQLSSLEISRSKGISRGKSDKIDAKQLVSK